MSAGLGDVFSASGFLSTVANGALTGAGTGGVTALITGQNFFEGVWKGAVIGGGVAAVSYTASYLANGSYKSYYTTDNEIAQNGESYDAKISNETMNKSVNTKRIKNFTNEEIQEFGIGKEYVGKPTLDGHLLLGNEKRVLGWTKPVDFFTGKSDIVYSPLAAQNDILLGKVMVHETAHAFSQRFLSLSIEINSSYDVRLNTTDHLAIYKLEHLYATKQLYFKNGYVDITKIKGVFMEDINFTYNALSPFEKLFFNKAYDSFYKIFNRFMK
ncbi:hypothetical protein C1637_04085 [Chryseobacterium lactis]|uniref:Tox-MPTase4 domain-containing protein n=1 Tax=Chryseobacterium lactis TaxID=1241981 RepID=A0A3G6RP71_CHRLC|nr:hypothetical protein [Chryseobacterium lactis]AZA81763.1 hypothetical protein EG342_07480 [Chryseobacterium lactis]AZB06761.1 hypothetical protein EG341_23600 [Chryseobacterium lactis]PNW15612.1 hypothetical protein C1637_04085 [Chryseobacterium lactis]